MRLLRLDVECFGALVDRSFELDGDTFVVEGPNEAGKSSFHAAVETVFYGFQPATREAHPYATWGDDRRTLRLVALVETADGARWQVERRLASSAGLRLARDGEALAGPFLGNVALPELQGTPRALFRAVYSLTANEFREPNDEGLQELIDELLLGDSGLSGMRSVRTLRAELAEERARLWRRDNRGDPVDRRLQRELGDVRRAAREAADAERQLALDERELEDTNRRIEVECAALEALEHELEECELRAELTRLQRLRAEFESIDLSGFGAQPDGTHVELEDPVPLAHELRAARVALEAPTARLAVAPVLASARALELLRRANAIEHLQVEEAEDRHDERGLQDLDETTETERSRAFDLVRGFAPTVAEGLEDSPPGSRSLSSLPLGALRSAARAWRGTCEQRAAALATGQRRLLPGLGVVFVGLCGAGAAALTLAPLWLGVMGAALSVTALAALVLLAATDGRHSRAAARTPAAIAGLAVDIGLDPACLVGPDAVLDALGALDEADEALGRAAVSHARAERVTTTRATRHALWRSLADEAGLLRLTDAPQSLPVALLPRLLRETLDAARDATRSATSDAAERASAEATLAAARQLNGELRARQRALHNGLHRALNRALPSTATPGAAFEELQRLQHERTVWEGEWRQLARRPRFAALVQERGASATESEATLDIPEATADGSEGPERAPVDADELRRQRTRTRSFLDDAQRKAGELAERLRTRRGTTPSELRERERQLEDELRDTRQAHDRLALLERALVVGERRFRAAHQPDVLRAASESLEAITAGRYGGIDYPDPDARRLVIRSNVRGERVTVGPPLSRGVREQVQLCLRLGTLEHLDRGREPLPLVLDEALVHWDPARRAALYPTLRALTARRQVILMTCQPDHAREAVAGIGARRVELSGPDTRDPRGGPPHVGGAART